MAEPWLECRLVQSQSHPASRQSALFYLVYIPSCSPSVKCPEKGTASPEGSECAMAKRSRPWKTGDSGVPPRQSWKASVSEEESAHVDRGCFFHLELILRVFPLCHAASASCCWAQGTSFLLRIPPPTRGVQMVGPDLLESSRWWGQYKCMTESNSRRSFLRSSVEPIHRVTGKALSDGLREAFEGQTSCKPPSCSCSVTVVVTSHLPLGSYLYPLHVCSPAILSWEASRGTRRYPSQKTELWEEKVGLTFQL